MLSLLNPYRHGAPAGGIVFLAAATATLPNTTGTTLTITKPSGVVSGKFMIASIRHREAFTSAPSGWTLIGTALTDSISFHSLYWLIAGGSEPADYSWAMANTVGRCSGCIIAYSGVHATTPINASGSQATASQPGTPNNLTQVRAPDITTTVANCMIIRSWGAQRTTGGITVGIVAPAGTERCRIEFSTANRQLLTMAEVLQPSSGATGTSIGTPTTDSFIDASRNAWTVALAPA